MTSPESHATPESLLLVDDDEGVRKVLARGLRELGFDVTVASSGSEALEIARTVLPRHAVVDLRLPDVSGTGLLAELLRVSPSTKVVMCTGFGSIRNAVEATKLGVVDYLTKPVEADAIARVLRGAGAGIPAEAAAPSLRELEWEHIHRVLRECGDNVSEAARRLKVDRRTLQRTMRRGRPPR